MEGWIDTMMQCKRRRRRSTIGLLSIAILASLCLNKLINFNINDNSANYLQFNNQKRYLLLDNDILTSLHTDCNYNSVNATDEDYDIEAAHAANITLYEIGSLLQEGDTTSTTSPSSYQTSTIQNYTLTDALNEATIFEHTFCILLYDPPTDKFLILYSHNHRSENSNRKLWKAIRNFTYLLRQVFPNRFTPDSNNELIIPIGSGDYPQINKNKLPHNNIKGIAPVLQFGSVFRDIDFYSNMIAMPMPEPHHLYCFSKWIASGMKRVCNELTELEFSGEWDGLIPQVVWRGTDFGYLQSLQPRPSLIKPYMNSYVDPLKDYKTRRTEAIHSLNQQFDKLLPRWKAVALTANAELQAEGTTDNIPWANMKLSSYIFAGKSPTIGSVRYAAWESVGIATGEHMSLQELAKYKYHIDLGGGGGTTWSGTIEKLGMPGLLFHHVTPMKDYLHDHLIPWKHYIPVSADLKDLKQKFDWAESHPLEAQRIADASTEFMRELSTPQGFEKMFEQAFVEPLSRIIDSYRPVASAHDGMSWRELFQSMGKDCHVWPVMECTGMDRSSCTMFPGGKGSKAEKMNWVEYGGHMTVQLSDSAKALIDETNPEQQPREMPFR